MPLLTALVLAVAQPTPLDAQAPEKLPGMTGTAAGALILEEPHASFPDTYQGASVEHVYSFRNRGAGPVRITAGIALSGTGRVTFEPALVAPGAAGTVHVSQPLSVPGRVSFRFALVTDEPGVSRYRMSLSGFAESAYDPETARLALGTVDRAGGGSAQLELFSREVDALQVLRVEQLPPFLSLDSSGRVGLAKEGVKLRVSVRPGAPLGLSTGTLRLFTNVPNQPEYELSYVLQVFGDTRPSQHPIAFDLLRAGQAKTIDVSLANASGRALQVLSAEDPAGLVSAELLPCVPPSPSCARLQLTALVEDVRSLEGVLNVRTLGDPETLPLRYVGWVVSPRTEVRTLDSSTSLSGLFSGPPDPPPFAPVAPSPSPSPEPSKAGNAEIRLTWKARNEGTHHGYLVYRAERPEGPFRRISRAIVPISAGATGDVAHQFVDREVVPGREYYYYLDVVGPDGRKQRFTGVQARRVAGAESHP